VLSAIKVGGGTGGGGVTGGLLPPPPPPPQAVRNTNISGSIRNQFTVDEIEITSIPLVSILIMHRECFADISRLP
jgi:hypothetical protein